MLEILFIDPDLLAVNKPSGWLVIPDRYQPSLPNLRDHLSKIYENIWVVHRLDKETSGVLLFARTAAMHRALNKQFTQRTIEKLYRLLAIGEVKSNSWEISLPLRIDGDRAHRTVIDMRRGKSASTHFQVCNVFQSGVIQMTAQPLSGYTHQIRVHAAAAGFWLLHDRLYYPWNEPPHITGARPHLPIEYRRLAEQLPIQRLALHAESIAFIHPVTQQPVKITAPLPQDFQSTLDGIVTAGEA